MIKRTALVLILPLFLLACGFPPYNEDLSLAVLTAEKMVDLGAETRQIGPLPISRYEFEGTDFYFVPNKGNGFGPEDFMSGFIVRADERDIRLLYIRYEGKDAVDNEDLFAVYGWWWGMDMINEDPRKLNYRVETLKGSNPYPAGPPSYPIIADYYLSFARYNANNYQDNRLLSLRFEEAAKYINEADNRQLNMNLPTSGPSTIVGSSIYPFDDWPPATDVHYFLCKIDGSGTYDEIEAPTDLASGINYGAAAPIPARINMPLTLPSDLENAFYYHHTASGRSYVSTYSAVERKYKNYYWHDSGLIKPMVKMERRIDALLSNGDLLSFENNRCYIYNSEGEQVSDFVLGGLHFVFEMFLFSEYAVFFTVPLWSQEWDQEELYFRVYALPTNKLRELR